ncbi:MAG: aldo/keto reductase [Coriobacteriales bacterium]|jgi:aryl-alcohol dehydrogenase-like predicted oxidoreductase
MEKRFLGTSKLEVSALGLGCMGFSHAYGAPMDEAEAIQVIRTAVEMGYTFFDTAEIYGPQDDPNANERLVGKALAPYRDKVVIATKFGIHFDLSSDQVPYPIVTDSSPARIRSSVEGSLKRLGTDHIDLYFQHRTDANTEPEEVASVMADLIKEGKIRTWGISEANESYLRRANAVCPVTAIENRYSMMARWHEALFGTLEELGVGFVAFSPMANGLLTGKYTKPQAFDEKYDYRSNMPQFSDESYTKNRELIELLERIAKEKQGTPAQVSLAWMLCKKPYIVPIPGTRKTSRLKENAGATALKLTADEISHIDALLDEIPMSDVFGGSKVTPEKN